MRVYFLVNDEDCWETIGKEGWVGVALAIY